MDLIEIITLAFESLRVNKLRSALTALGIIIGVASVILLVSLGAGLRSYITSQFEQLGSNLLFVVPGRLGAGGRGPGGQVINKLNPKHITKIEKQVENLDGVVPTIQQFTSVKYQNKVQKDVTIIGTSHEFGEVTNLTITRGQFFNKSQNDTGRRVAVIGQTIVKDLFEEKNSIGEILMIKGQKYQIIGIAKERGTTFGFDQDNTVIVPILALQRQFGVTQINNIYAKASDQADVEKVAENIKKVLLEDLTEDDFSVLTAQQTLETIQGILRVISTALAGIAAISLLVGGIGISNIMLVTVTERTREIGLRKAVGATPRDILLQFLTEAITLSVAGGLIGLSIASIATIIISRFIPALITPWSVIIAFGFSAVVGIVFGVAPAIRASRLEPIVALRHE
ncbi:ABC transporter permease [Candidatus Curtissbacteria bacterium]|nr:ABC transporter permease [Candidatus Curtissbacteria bacterium]